MDNYLLDEILRFYHENNWKNILKLSEKPNGEKVRKILWAWPSESNLDFLKNCLNTYKVQGITSVGCGCGLLEWIIEKYTAIPVLGIEVNREWWESKYSNPCFIPLNYVDDDPNISLDSTYALLFCYFNNGPAFRQYINKYCGRMVIIIGPNEGSGRHTDPQPFSPNFGSDDWHLTHSQELKNSNDFITIYLREYITI